MIRARCGVEVRSLNRRALDMNSGLAVPCLQVKFSQSVRFDMLQSRQLQAACGLLVFAFFIRLAFMTGPVGSDDQRYFAAAATILGNEPLTTTDLAAGRLAFLALVGFPGAAFGSLYLSALANVLYATFLDVLVVWYVLKLLGERAAFVAAVVMALSGLLMTFSGTFLPEILLALFLVLGVIAIDVGMRNARDKAVAFILAGVALGLAYSTKETALLAIPPVAAGIALGSPSGTSWRDRIMMGVWLCLGFALVWLVTCTVYWLVAGDFFYQSRMLSERHNAHAEVATDAIAYVRMSWWSVQGVLDEPGFLAAPLAIAFMAWIACLRERGGVLIFALLGVFMTIYLTVGTSSLSRPLLLPFQERYYLPVVPFAAVCIASVLTRKAVLHRAASWIGGAVAVTYAILSIHGSATRSGSLYFAEALRSAAILVRSSPDSGALIVADERLGYALRFVLPENDYARVRWVYATSRAEPVASPDSYFIAYRRAEDPEGQSFHTDSRMPSRVCARLQMSNSMIARVWPTAAPPGRYVVELRGSHCSNEVS